MSEVERYLDEMFDRLAGTGAAGRRALAETEDHLRAAVAAGLAEGLPEQRAEHEAVVRFGPAALVAGQVRRVHRAGPVRAAVSAAWLVAGVGLSWLGVTFLAAFFFPGPLRLVHISFYDLCSNFLSPSCYIVTWKTVAVGLVLLIAGVILLAARRLGRRFFGLASTGLPVSALVVSLFAIAALALYESPVVTAGPVPGLRLITIGAAAAAVMAAARNLVQGRRSRWLTQLDSR
jgi:hypothetical protein